MPAKILQFPKENAFYDFLDRLRQAYDENRLMNFLCIYDYSYREGKERPVFIVGVNKYWWGSSTTECLGLCEIMKQEVLNFIKEKNDEG